jgi:predicted nucleotidyltransferase component of viral defense system
MIRSLYWETMTPFMRDVLVTFYKSEVGKRFYLAGGTALALQLYHRISVDLDFFTQEDDVISLRLHIQDSLKQFHPVLAGTAFGNLNLLADNLRLGFYTYGYPLVSPLVQIEDLRLAGIEDIGLMKLDALLGRADRKDFIDLYAICQRVTLRSLLDLASQKYRDVRDFETQVVRHLVGFERADAQESPRLLQDIHWEEVKAHFRQQAVEIGQSWLEPPAN